MRVLEGLVAVVLLGGLVAAPVSAVAERPAIEQAKQYLEAGDAEQAYARLSPLQAELAGDPDYDYLLGIAALDSGRPTEAIFALERVLAVKPDHLLARAEIARAYFMLGEFATAKQEFETLESTEIPPAARATIERYLTAFERIPGKTTQVRAYVAVTVGYDSNVNAATSERAIAIPRFGGVIARLNDAGVEASDLFGQGAGGVSLTHPLGEDLAFNAGVDAYQTVLDDDTSFEQGSVSGYAGLEWTRGRNIYTGVVQADHFVLDHDPFRNFFGILGQVRHLLNNVSQVTGYVQAGRLVYDSQSIRNANRYVLGAAYSRVFPGKFTPSAYIGAYLGTEAEHASGVDQLGYDLGGARVGGRMTLTPDTTLFAAADVEHRNYGGTDPLFLVGRRDTRYTLRAGARYTPVAKWTVSPTVEYTRNDSNVVINNYDRLVLSVTLRRDFD